MHLTAFFAALDVWDLDATAKHALQVICARVDHPATFAEVPLQRLAIDMGVHYVTGVRAVGRVVEAGYVAVEKRPGGRSVYRLNLDRLATDPLPSAKTPLALRHGTLSAPLRQEESLDLKKKGAPRRAAPRAGGAPVEDPPPQLRRTPPPHPPECECRGTGLILHPDPRSNDTIRCPGLAPIALADSLARHPSNGRRPQEGR